MLKRRGYLPALPAIMIAAMTAHAQSRSAAAGRIDVTDINVAADVNPRTQSIAAKANIKLKAVDDKVSSATFDLHNALTVIGVFDTTGGRIDSTRNSQEFNVRVTFEPPLAKGEAKEIVVQYEGKLTGAEESPVYGIKFAAIKPE